MKKIGLFLGVAVLAIAGFAQAENAGIGFEYGAGLQIPFTSGVSANGLVNSFVVSWQVNDNFIVGVFRDEVSLRAERKYTNDATQVTYKLAADGMEYNSGIRVGVIVPGLEMLQAGFDLGTANIETGSATYTRSDGSAAGSADFTGSVAPETLSGQNPLVGLNAKFVLVNSKAKGIWTEIAVLGNVRMVPVTETYLFGSREANSSKPVNERNIDPVTSMNSANVMLGITLGF